MALLEVAFLVWFKSPYNTLDVGTQEEMWTYGLLGGGVVLFVVFILAAVKFENNRWEVYF